MAILIIGVVLWGVIHTFPSWAPARRAALAEELGEKKWRGLFSLATLATLLLMILGWRLSLGAGFVYAPPAWGWHLNNLLMLIAFVLLGAGHMKSNLRRVIRHPMLTAVVLWSVAHLLANGDLRSVVLFGGLGVWAVAAQLLANRRDGAWEKPPASPVKKDLIAVAAGLVVFVVVALVHPWIFGVSPFPV